jgi:hypothetical protein
MKCQKQQCSSFDKESLHQNLSGTKGTSRVAAAAINCSVDLLASPMVLHLVHRLVASYHSLPQEAQPLALALQVVTLLFPFLTF